MQNYIPVKFWNDYGDNFRPPSSNVWYIENYRCRQRDILSGRSNHWLAFSIVCSEREIISCNEHMLFYSDDVHAYQGEL